jgi:phosphogluconate dehydratase
MSGASGKVPAAIHVSPEAATGGPLARVMDGDIIRLCGHDGTLELQVAPAVLAARAAAPPPRAVDGTGRELFALLRIGADDAERGASAMLVAAGL